MSVDAIYRMTPDVATNLGIMTFSFICPGFLLWYMISPTLFVELDFLKLLVLSVAVSAPTFVVPYILSFCFFAIMKGRGQEKLELYGGPRSWYLRHGINNALSMHAIVALSYCFGASGGRLLLFVAVAVLFGVLHEVYYSVRFAINPSKNNSMIIFNEGARSSE